MASRPENIGIKAIEIYFPNQVGLTMLFFCATTTAKLLEEVERKGREKKNPRSAPQRRNRNPHASTARITPPQSPTPGSSGSNSRSLLKLSQEDSESIVLTYLLPVV